MGNRLDLVLAGGRVIDGTGAPGRTLDIGISGQDIAVVAPAGTLRSDRTIVCKNLTVAPAFIDTHSHSDLRVLVDPTLPSKSRQGVGMEVLGQDGISVAPLTEGGLEETQRRLAGLLGSPNVPWSWRSVGQYLDALAAVRPSVDLAYLVPHGAVRQAVMGMEDRAPTDDELARMVAGVERALAEGAVGISTGLIYPPCCYGNTDELVALCRPVATAGGCFVVHMRSESDEILRAVREVIDVARRSGVRLHISHIKVAGIQNFAVVEEMIDLLEAARDSGVTITADQYPYTAGSTMLGAILPPWMHAGGLEETLARLASPDVRERLRHELGDPSPVAWDNFWKWSGPEGIVVADIPSGRDQDLVGRSLAESAARKGADPFAFAFDLLLSERLGVSMISHSQSEAVVARFLSLPWVNVCTDGLLGARPHPRTYGTYPRVLGRYVRDQGLLSWEEAIRKMTSQAADALGLARVGRLVAGHRANVVVFDAERVKDEATFAEPVRFPLGVRHVIVGGAVVVRDEVGTRQTGAGVVQRGVARAGDGVPAPTSTR